jgi:O-acetyl-ADP-ribose deacetylase (regulator of RNase III)
VGQVRPVSAAGTRLEVDWVLNTVGPILGIQRAGALRAGEVLVNTPEEAGRILAAAYENAFRMATALGVQTLAVPAISTGVYGVPHSVCAQALMYALARCPYAPDVTIYLYGPALKPGELGAWHSAADHQFIELED